jgi:hypothetical protein
MRTYGAVPQYDEDKIHDRELNAYLDMQYGGYYPDAVERGVTLTSGKRAVNKAALVSKQTPSTSNPNRLGDASTQLMYIKQESINAQTAIEEAPVDMYYITHDLNIHVDTGEDL